MERRTQALRHWALVIGSVITLSASAPAPAAPPPINLVPGATSAGVAGDTGWESGSYTPVDGAGTVVDSGSYLSVSRKADGKWLYVRDIYNSDRPLPPAPAPPATEEVRYEGSR